MDWSWWRPGDLVSWGDVFPDDFQLMFSSCDKNYSDYREFIKRDRTENAWKYNAEKAEPGTSADAKKLRRCVFRSQSKILAEIYVAKCNEMFYNVKYFKFQGD